MPKWRALIVHYFSDFISLAILASGHTRTRGSRAHTCVLAIEKWPDLKTNGETGRGTPSPVVSVRPWSKGGRAS